MMREEVLNRIYGGWFGKCLGGAAGAMVEGVKNFDAEIDFKDIYNKDLPNDDLDIQLLWLEALEEKGKSLTMHYMSEKWLKQCWYPFSEYGQFLYNFERGIVPPISGTYNNSFYENGMGCPIRAEIWAYAFFGQPDLAVKYAEMDGRLDHGDESVYAEMYMAAVESICDGTSTMLELLKSGLNYVDKSSRFVQMAEMVFACYEEGKTFAQIRNEILLKYGHLDFTNSIQNMGFVLLALLFGDLDMEKVINIALNLGYDTDCTCGNAAAILGTFLGYDTISEDMKALLTDQFVCGIDVIRKDDTILSLAQDTVKLYEQLLEDDREPFELAYVYENGPSMNLGETKKVKIEHYEEIETFTMRPIVSSLSFIMDKQEGVIIFLADKELIFDKNVFEITATRKSGEVFVGTIGVAGSPTYKGRGIFLEQADYPYNPAHPYCHGEGCVLPSVENMVNNKVELDKAYIEEDTFDKEFTSSDFTLKCRDMFLPWEDAIAYQGQMCMYLQTTIVSPINQTVWLLANNTDGFKIWMNGREVIAKDEMRCFTAENNCEIVDLVKGDNIITIKLLRRTDYLKFALAFNEYEEGKHHHATKGLTNLIYKY